MRIFGESAWAFRLPSALLGVLTVYLIYLLGRRLFSAEAGLIAAALSSVTVHQVYVSRVGLQEAFVIALVVAGMYFFIRSQEQSRYLLAWGAIIGIGALTKYTTVILPFASLIFAAIYWRPVFRARFFWWALVLALLLAAPVIYYNVALYRAVGHFDLQLAYLFHQATPEWSVLAGRELAGSLAERLLFFFPNFMNVNSIVFCGVSLSALLLAFGRVMKKGSISGQEQRALVFGGIWLVVTLLVVAVIGPSTRFLTLLTPILALAVGYFCGFLRPRPRWLITVVVCIVLLESMYSVNTLLMPRAWGMTPWTYSQLHFDTYNWGYRQLGEYLARQFDGYYPEFRFNSDYSFLNRLQERAVIQAQAVGARPRRLLVIYDDNVYNAPQLWYIDRWFVAHGWPVIKASTYLTLREKLQDPLADTAHFDEAIVIIANEHILPQPERTEAAQQLETQLREQGAVPESLATWDGSEAFRLYKTPIVARP